MQFALKAQVERFVAKDKEVRCAKDWEEERLDGLGGGVARHQGREGGEAEAEGGDGQLGLLFLLYDPKVRTLLDALMFELVLVWPMVILLKSEMQRLRFEDGTNDY